MKDAIVVHDRKREENKRKLYERRVALFFILPAVILFLVMAIYPFIYMIYTSFTNLNLSMSGTGRFIGLANYVEIFHDSLAMGSITFSAMVLLIAVPIEMVMGILFGLLIRGLRGERIFRLLFLIPMMIPGIVFGISAQMIFNYLFGAANYFLSFFSVPEIAWLGQASTAQFVILLLDIIQWTPFVFLITYAGLLSVPQDLIDAARVDGASRWQLFRNVELPTLKSFIYIALIIRLIDALKIFGKIYMTTWGGPGMATSSWSFYIYKVGVSYGWDIGYASALAIILLIVSSILVNLLIKVLNLGETLELKKEG
ncbi:carbohydrate ABC transporter permease [Mesoaciditoga lauensis]|uniref:carbohydrate ABC transporter permease n=1 Tax=Mesoaciditoga lauensis TaxID=1495039 RepID=UPI001B80A162|nr:sugar ABC transporter permease [Mesoaciditoga lauensis]